MVQIDRDVVLPVFAGRAWRKRTLQELDTKAQIARLVSDERTLVWPTTVLQ